MIPIVPYLLLQFGHPHSDAVLVSAERVVRPGENFLVGIHLRLDPTWHTYWVNPGDSGTPPTVDWSLPKGWNASPIMWPIPEKVKGGGGLVNYGYRNEVTLLTRIQVPLTANPGECTLKADVKWLICQAGCLPAEELASHREKVRATSEADPNWAATLQEEWQSLPEPELDLKLTARRAKNEIILEADGAPSHAAAEFYSLDGNIEASAKQEPIIAADIGMERLTTYLAVSPFAPKGFSHLRGIWVLPPGELWGNGRRAVIVNIPVESKGGSTP